MNSSRNFLDFLRSLNGAPQIKIERTTNTLKLNGCKERKIEREIYIDRKRERGVIEKRKEGKKRKELERYNFLIDSK